MWTEHVTCLLCASVLQGRKNGHRAQAAQTMLLAASIKPATSSSFSGSGESNAPNQSVLNLVPRLRHLVPGKPQQKPCLKQVNQAVRHRCPFHSLLPSCREAAVHEDIQASICDTPMSGCGNQNEAGANRRFWSMFPLTDRATHFGIPFFLSHGHFKSAYQRTCESQSTSTKWLTHARKYKGSRNYVRLGLSVTNL